jgi:hypothetical protein
MQPVHALGKRKPRKRIQTAAMLQAGIKQPDRFTNPPPPVEARRLQTLLRSVVGEASVRDALHALAVARQALKLDLGAPATEEQVNLAKAAFQMVFDTMAKEFAKLEEELEKGD